MFREWDGKKKERKRSLNRQRHVRTGKGREGREQKEKNVFSCFSVRGQAYKGLRTSGAQISIAERLSKSWTAVPAIRTKRMVLCKVRKQELASQGRKKRKTKSVS